MNPVIRSVRQARTLYRLAATFSVLDQARAIAEIRRLADSGLTEPAIVARTGWAFADVCRALQGRV